MIIKSFIKYHNSYIRHIICCMNLSKGMVPVITLSFVLRGSRFYSKTLLKMKEGRGVGL